MLTEPWPSKSVVLSQLNWPRRSWISLFHLGALSSRYLLDHRMIHQGQSHHQRRTRMRSILDNKQDQQ